MTSLSPSRKLPIGAEVLSEGGAHFRVWAPIRREVRVVVEDGGGAIQSETRLASESGGYFSGVVPSAGAGTLYRFRLDGGADLFPDPASRFQPNGPHGPSQVIDPSSFRWTDQAWNGTTIRGQVLYELHVGTFTREGTWRATMDALPPLRALGITAIEVMPVAEFGGCFGWGYDGVDLYAPSHLYGSPDDFRALVDRAHALGLAVILDVVYNHLGPDGNYLKQFSPSYFTTRYGNEWGEALNFDDNAAPVRTFMVSNAGCWIREFHLDGLRFDATQQIFDSSEPHLLEEMSRHARRSAGGRSILLVAENEPQDVRLVMPLDAGGFGLDALWNDDFHHTAVVTLTGRREAYYTDYRGTPQELASLVKWGFLFQGQRYLWQRKRRGTPALGVAPFQFVTFLENHDQVANSPTGRGERLHQLASPGAYRALTALWLLSPGTPMFFQGQEFAASSPFMYFADHQGPLREAVRAGRAELMRQFRSASAGDLYRTLPDPGDRGTFDRCRLSHEERDAHGEAVALHRDLLRLRRSEAAFNAQRAGWVDGAVLSDRALVLRFFSSDPRERPDRDSPAADRLVIVNLGDDLLLDPAPEPLLAPPAGTAWSIRWSSDDPAYGGAGVPPLDEEAPWRIPGQATIVVAPSVPSAGETLTVQP